MKKKKYLIFCLIFLFFVLFFVFATFENRYYFKFNNKDFTIWNTKKGCYLILEKYKGLNYPKDNYCLFDNKINITIFVDNQNVYHIFSYNCNNGYTPKTSFTDISYCIHPYITKEANIQEIELYENSNFPYFDYYARDNWGNIKEKNSEYYEVLT